MLSIFIAYRCAEARNHSPKWIPIAQTNKDMTLEVVYEQSNQKIESVFGVPDEVCGHLQDSNYASAEVTDDYQFSAKKDWC